MEDKPYEEMSLEELKKLKEEREKQKLIEELKSYDTVEEPENPPENPISNEGETVLADENSIHMKVWKRFKNNGLKFINYENEDWVYTNDTSDSGCDDDVSAWSPDDVYSNIIWSSFISDVDLMDIAVKGIDVKQGDGMTVKIRAFGSMAAPSQKTSCETASCASITFSTYSLTIHQYNLEAIVCDADIWDVGSPLMDAYLKAMSDSWKTFFNTQIYSALTSATPGTTKTLANALSCTPTSEATCCFDTSLRDLYDAIISAVADMRENYYKPDYIIVSPSVAAIFKRMQTPKPIFYDQVSFDSSGKLSSIAGLKVIEYEGATSCTNSSGAKVAVIVDSRRAVGVAFGKKPKFYKEFLQNSNAYRLDYWAYVGFGALDTNAICHIVNP